MTQTLSEVESLDNIKRVRFPSVEEFRADYLGSEQPIIFTNALDGEPIARVKTLADVRQRLGNVSIDVQRNYAEAGANDIRSMLEGQAALREKARITINEYLDLVERDPVTTHMVTDCGAPRELLALVSPPKHFEFPGCAINQVFFMSNAGNASDLHTDWHGQYATLYQIVGRKRVIVIPGEESQKIIPVEIHGGLRLRELPSGQKLDFLRFARAFDSILYPGDMVFIPRMLHHHLEYIDTGLAVSFRFGHVSKYATFCLKQFHRDVFIQNVVRLMLDEQRVEREYMHYFLAMKTLAEKTFSSSLEKYREVRSVSRKICEEVIGPGMRPLVRLDLGDVLDRVLCKTHRYSNAPPK